MKRFLTDVGALFLSARMLDTNRSICRAYRGQPGKRAFWIEAVFSGRQSVRFWMRQVLSA